ncbi:unnamed protein product [Bathycoccus prasinos]
MFTSKKKCNEVYLPIEGDIILGIVAEKSSSHLLIDWFIFQVLPLVARMLLHSKDVLTKSINISHPLEIAVGYNGLIWFHSRPSVTEMQFLLLISKYYAH